MTLICPHCQTAGSGPRFIKRHFVDELCKVREDFTKQLAQTTKVVDDEDVRSKYRSPRLQTAANALRKKEI